jgi:hypothetical protein
MQLDGLAALYSSKTDDELLRLAADQESLHGEARDVLAEELRRRNLENSRPNSEAEDSARGSRSAWLSRLKWLGLWLLNTVIATVGVAINVGLFTYSTQAFVSRPFRIALVQTPYYPFPILIGVLVGFFGHLRFRGSYRYWAWVLPALLTWNALLDRQSSNQASWSDAIVHFFGYIPYPQNRDQLDTSVVLYMAFAYSLGALMHRMIESRKSRSAEQNS